MENNEETKKENEEEQQYSFLDFLIFCAGILILHNFFDKVDDFIDNY